MGIFDWFTKRTLTKAEINSIMIREWEMKRNTIDQIIINECNKLDNQEDLALSLRTGLHKEFVTKTILDLFIDNFGYELGFIHGTNYNVEEVARTRNEQVMKSFFDRMDMLNWKDLHKIKKCYKEIAKQVCIIGRSSGRDNYSLFKDTLIRK